MDFSRVFLQIFKSNSMGVNRSMILLSNIRTEIKGDYTRLAVDFTWDAESCPFRETTIWFAVKNENADFFTTEVYDPFVLVPFYIAMHYGQDLKICGRVSKLLYKNLTNYVQRILQDFSDEMKPITFTVEGFDEPEKEGNLVGAGISCGIDSLSTIYDRYVKETDPEYRINALFLFNCGTHGDYEDDISHKLFEARYTQNKRAADDLGLPIYTVDSNLHAFTHKIAEQKVGFFALWSCMICLQRKVNKYYVSSGFAYQDIVDFQKHNHDFDMDGYCGSYVLPLVQTENIRLIYDGAQYKRTEKTKNIADWDIAQKHLSVCVKVKETAENCSCCPKCFRTLIALESLDKLEEFSGRFDLEKYHKTRFKNACNAIVDCKKENFDADNIAFAREHNVKLPPKLVAYACVGGTRAARYVVNRLFSKDAKEKLKQMLAKNI